MCVCFVCSFFRVVLFCFQKPGAQSVNVVAFVSIYTYVFNMRQLSSDAIVLHLNRFDLAVAVAIVCNLLTFTVLNACQLSLLMTISL